MQSVEQALSRALELLESGDTAAAAAALREFLSGWRNAESERTRSLNDVRHQIGNALAIAQASVEGMLDGVVQIDDRRLNRVRDILSEVSASMYALTSCDGFTSAARRPEPDAVTALAQTKGVALNDRCADVAGAQRERLNRLLLAAVRYTQPGRGIDVDRSDTGGIVVRVDSSAAAQVLGGTESLATLAHDDGRTASLQLNS